MWSRDLGDVFPFLNTTSYLAIVTPEQGVTAATDFQRIKSQIAAAPSRVSYCSEVDLAGALRGFGLQIALPPAVLHELYEITHGHLAVVEQLAGYLRSVGQVQEIVHRGGLDEFCRRMLRDKLAAYDISDERLLDILTQCSTIGRTFTLKEVTCLSGRDAADAARALRKVAALNIVRTGDEPGRFEFCHEIFPKVLSDTSDADFENRHRVFADCLRLIRPGDYGTRAAHYEAGGDFESASTMRAHYTIAAVRARRLSVAEAVDHYREAGLLSTSVRAIIQAYASYDDGDYNRALTLLGKVDPLLPKSIGAEADILIARCYVKLLVVEDQRKAVQILRQVTECKDAEGDIWQRAMLWYVVALAFMGKMEDARSAAAELGHSLRAAPYDLDATRTFNRLRLRGDMYLSADGAYPGLKDAVVYFGPTAQDAVARDPLNYYIALTNLAGNGILRGEFQEALDTVGLCRYYLESVRGTVDDMTFPRPDMLISNGLIASYRMGVQDAASCLQVMAEVIAAIPATKDRPLHRNNQSVYLAESDRFTEAVEILRTAYDALHAVREMDAFYRYYVGSNLTMAMLGAGDLDSARAVWKSIPSPVCAAPSAAQYLVPRHELIGRHLEVADASFDACRSLLLQRAEMGDGWRHFGHPMLFSELQLLADE